MPSAKKGHCGSTGPDASRRSIKPGCKATTGDHRLDSERENAMDIINVDYSESIPNNVNLADDRRVLKALEGWHPENSF